MATAKTLATLFSDPTGSLHLSLDMQGNSGTVLSKQCGSQHASGVDVRSFVHASHERKQVSTSSAGEM